jgi:hypothetical protein
MPPHAIPQVPQKVASATLDVKKQALSEPARSLIRFVDFHR